MTRWNKKFVSDLDVAASREGGLRACNSFWSVAIKTTTKKTITKTV
ncbi:MAG: hypothetical protein L3J21_01790 [Devosiaceae bacterium]|nr:hypothetical protein [Devosiaceae bacterium]